MRNTTRQRIRRTPQRPAADHRPMDAAGTIFDPERHIAPDRLTKAGKFRLKPGKSHA